MTITLRIQFKGEGARKLAAEESGRLVDDPPPSLQDLTRTLSLFTIPTPDSTRVIHKSGFILCNYNITRESVSVVLPPVIISCEFREHFQSFGGL